MSVFFLLYYLLSVDIIISSQQGNVLMKVCSDSACAGAVCM